MSAHAQPRLTPEQYLEIERAADCKSEYYNGRMYAMAGASFTHGVIVGNLTRHFGNALEKRPCFVVPNDLRLRVAPTGLFTYPDLAIVCGEPRFADGRVDTLLNPTVIVEVISPSTEAYDRGFKFAQYRGVESLQEYMLVSQTEPLVEIFRRDGNGEWVLSAISGAEGTCRLRSLDCELPLAAIYQKVTFAAEDVPSQLPSGG
jgi:Uma2 family endonuclease